MHKRSLATNIFLLFLPLLILLLFILFPFYWTFITSIKPEQELYTRVLTYWPQAPTWQNYRDLFVKFDFVEPIKNSLLVAAMATIVSLVVSLLAAYAFSRFEFKGKKIFMVMFLTNNMFPTVLLLIPLYTLMRQLGLLFTPASLVLSYTTFTIPFSVWLLNGYLHDLPHSLEEVALVDGANRAQAFLRIILPLMIPCLIATGVYIFMTSWNEYTFAVMFTNADNRTIPVALKKMVGQFKIEWGLLTAGGIITIIPVCTMFFFAQKRLVEGLTAGAVKG
ncbi:MAG: multiple sugar transport system permease protein [Clostridiales bacterium]|jgi:multiple sugar transport system permease protein|nr:carbohydrate ABC transporter permease [Eubacteriales bacterium]MDD3198406.1 carbohydrate ABC transporter permease [Eubacteriales bacterium]MDD3504590.1 carbohydrate ABC transporter permease [Eubacteriales bacterium]MDD4683510.1 carbohydrate ABC transporter permease [Eubacteriales bacterium]MDN5314877.1 multiple sugar transport system permease protein [Clostridiales bacterium]